MGKKCKLKFKFKTFREAKQFAQTYMNDIPLTFYPMTAYYCNKHKSFHVGHDRYVNGVDKNSEAEVN